MHRMLRTAILITSGLLIIGIISGCGDDPPEEVTDPRLIQTDEAGPHLHELMMALRMMDPLTACKLLLRGGDHIPPKYPVFTLTFDQTVVAVTVNGAAATGSGLNWNRSRIDCFTGRRRSNC